MNQSTRNALAGLAGLVSFALGSCGGSGDGTFLPASVTVTITDVSQDEGQAGPSSFTFQLALSQPHPLAVSVDFATLDGTAQDESGDGDYRATSGTAVFAPGSLTSTIVVEVNGDEAYELDESFQVLLSNPSGLNLSIADSVGQGTIRTDDFAAEAAVSVAPVSVVEGNAGQTILDFLVTLSAPLAHDVSYRFATLDGTAESEGGDGDYQSASGILAFEAGHTEQHLYVLVNGDTKVEADESFTVSVFDAASETADQHAAQATAVIENEDAAAIVVHDVAVEENDQGTFELRFDVALTAEHTQLVSVDYATNDGTATSLASAADYVARAGTLHFDPGTTVLSVAVTAVGDFLGEGDEFFTLDLANESGPDVSILVDQGIGTLIDDDSDTRLDTDATAGQSVEPAVAVADGYLYSAWSDERDGAADVYFNLSADGGATWLASDLRLDTDAPGSASSTHVRICAEGAQVYVVWQDDRDGDQDIYFNRSTDHGQTWLASELRLDSGNGAPSSSTDPRIACSAGSVHVVWTDDRDGGPDVYYNHSSDQGTSWQRSEQRLDLGATPSSQPRIAAAGDRVHAVWIEDGLVHSNSSSDGGQSWFETSVRVDHDGGAQAHDAQAVQLATAGPAGLFVVWSDSRNGAADIYFQRSTDGGASFLAEDVRLDSSDAPGASASLEPRLSFSGSHLYVVWEDERDDLQLSGKGDVYINHSTTGGLTWFGDRRVPSGLLPGKSESTQARIASEGSQVQVVWMDDRHAGRYDLFANLSVDGGQSWLFQPVRLDSDPAGSAHSTWPEVVRADERLHVVWQDAREASDIYCRSLTLDAAPGAGR